MEETNYKVYRHKSFDDRVYIGVTCQAVERRWRNGQGYSHNDYFIRFVKKWGWDSMEHKILYDNLSKEEAERLERKLIAFYHSTDNRRGFNITDGGSLYGTHTEESKHKMSVTRRSHPDANAKPVKCIETHIVYASVRDAERQTGICSSRISSNCIGKQNSAGCDNNGNPLHWVYVNEMHKIPEIINDLRFDKEKECEKENQMFANHKEKCYSKLHPKPRMNERKTVFQYDLQGSLLNTYVGVVEAAQITGCNKSLIARVCGGYGFTCGGYLWSYEPKEFTEEYLLEAQNASKHQTILQYDFNMNLIAEYVDGEGLREHPKYNYKHIRDVCNRFHDCAYGFVWRFKGEPEEQYRADKEFYSKRKTFVREQSVVQYTMDGKIVKVHDSMVSADKEGYNRNRISRCCRGLQESYKGYIWKYAEQ